MTICRTIMNSRGESVTYPVTKFLVLVDLKSRTVTGESIDGDSSFCLNLQTDEETLLWRMVLGYDEVCQVRSITYGESNISYLVYQDGTYQVDKDGTVTKVR